MTEYVLPAAIIGCVMLLSLSLLGSNLLSAFQGTLFTSSSNLSERTLIIPPLGTLVTDSQAQITLQDGTVINVTHLVNNFKTSIESVGANGTTDQLAAALKNLAKQLKEAGKIDQDQFNKLEELANEGHNLALIQKQVEDKAMGSGNDIEKFKADKGTLLAAYMTQTHGTNSTYYVPTSQLNPNTLKLFGMNPHKPATGISLYNFLKAYETVAENGSLSDPAINQLVTTLSFQIKTLSLDVVTNRQYVMWHDGEFTPQELQSQMAASAETHLNSSIICATGGTADTGTHCPTY